MLALPFLIIAALLLITWFSTRNTKQSNENYPAKLRGARCIMNEEKIRTVSPVHLSGRIDQLYRTKKGVNIILDTKRRPSKKVYPSDIAQLSVYKVILDNIGHKTSSKAYIRFPPIGTESAIYREVTLLNEKAVINLYRKYFELKSHRRKAKCKCGKH